MGGKWNCEMMECAIFWGDGEGMEGEGPQDLHHILLAKKEISVRVHVYTWREKGEDRDEWG